MSAVGSGYTIGGGSLVTMTPPTGAWVTYARDNGPYVISIHASEIDALRAAVAYGAGAKVAFVAFGADFHDAIKEAEGR